MYRSWRPFKPSWEARPELTGDGTNIMKVDQKLIKEDVTADITMDDILGTLLLGGACYGVGRLFSKVLLPTVLGARFILLHTPFFL